MKKKDKAEVGMSFVDILKRRITKIELKIENLEKDREYYTQNEYDTEMDRLYNLRDLNQTLLWKTEGEKYH